MKKKSADDLFEDIYEDVGEIVVEELNNLFTRCLQRYPQQEPLAAIAVFSALMSDLGHRATSLSPSKERAKEFCEDIIEDFNGGVECALSHYGKDDHSH